MQGTVHIQRARHLDTTLDLVFGTARLVSYFRMVGNLKEAEEQMAIAKRDFDALLLDWTEFDMDTHADGALRQKRADVEKYLQVLAAGDD